MTADAVARVPIGVVADGAGNVYVLDANSSRIEKFAPSGDLIARWGFGGSGEVSADRSVGVSVDGAGNIYLLDAGTCRVRKYSPSGEQIGAWGFGSSGEVPTGGPGGETLDGAGARDEPPAAPPKEAAPAVSASPAAEQKQVAPEVDTVESGRSDAPAPVAGRGVDTVRPAASSPTPASTDTVAALDVVGAPGAGLKNPLRPPEVVTPARRPWWQFWK